MVELSIINKNNDVLLSKKGDNIDCMYDREYKDGDRIVINKRDTESLAV